MGTPRRRSQSAQSERALSGSRRSGRPRCSRRSSTMSVQRTSVVRVSGCDHVGQQRSITRQPSALATAFAAAWSGLATRCRATRGLEAVGSGRRSAVISVGSRGLLPTNSGATEPVATGAARASRGGDCQTLARLSRCEGRVRGLPCSKWRDIVIRASFVAGSWRERTTRGLSPSARHKLL